MFVRRGLIVVSFVVSLLAAACGDSGSSTDSTAPGAEAGADISAAPDNSTPRPDTGRSDTTPAADQSTSSADGAAVDTAVGDAIAAPDAAAAIDLKGVTCRTTPPANVTLAASPKAYSGGTCPQLMSGTNTITTAGGSRKFILIFPSKIQPGETLPVMFAWHWLKGKAQKFVDEGDLAAAVEQQRFIAVLPEAKGDLSLFGLVDLPWPILNITPQARYDEEFTFFDDMLACVSKQLPVNKECVSATGVSAGALYIAQLAGARGEYLSSVISLSGGVGSQGLVNMWLRPLTPPAHKMPTLVLWGGPADSCALLNFEVASKELISNLQAGGHYYIECTHNCQHGVPPVVAPPGKSRFSPIWEFALEHPFWLPAGQSPLGGGVSAPYGIPWCAVGATPTPRTGQCDPPGCPI
ncbi:MAG: hypothetical protein KC503_45245 [Myxococcales bacterium]|nr:hypothetical protein [Myxococcales bacterium]